VLLDELQLLLTLTLLLPFAAGDTKTNSGMGSQSIENHEQSSAGATKTPVWHLFLA
jgi:hypothetical protein